MMRILLIADMRSPHAVGWATGLAEIGSEMAIISSRRLSASERARIPWAVREHVLYVPSDIWSRARGYTTTHPHALAGLRRIARAEGRWGRATEARSRPEGTGRLELPLELSIAQRLARVIAETAREFRPDILHALRVPFEGIALGASQAAAPTAISIWGQDLARQAPSAPRLARATVGALAHVRGLHADCYRDLDLARQWGVPPTAATIVAPGNMGYDTATFNSAGTRHEDRTIVFCPRGPGSNVNFRGFLRAADVVTAARPDLLFVAARLEGNAEAESIRAACAYPERILLTGDLTPDEMASVYRRSLAVVSPSISDGTPNSVLEAMACGAVPIVGDIAPLRELLQARMPQSLFDPLNEAELADKILHVSGASREAWLRESATAQSIVSDRWSRDATLPRVADWYEEIVR